MFINNDGLIDTAKHYQDLLNDKIQENTEDSKYTQA